LRLFSEDGLSRFEKVCVASRALEAAWKAPGSEQDRMAEISLRTSELEALSDFGPADFTPGVSGCLALKDAPEPWRITQVDDEVGFTLRLRAEPGLDLRITEEDGRISLQGRRRPQFHLYEYLHCQLGPEEQEDSRRESMEGLIVQQR
jgi:hypothetical protein